MNKMYKLISSLILLMTFHGMLFSQHAAIYQFKEKDNVKLTEIKQGSEHSECYILTTTEFLEAEIANSGKGNTDLSDLFFLYNLFQTKSKKFFETEGALVFGPRGKPDDIIALIRNYGLMPSQGFYQAPPNQEMFQGEMIASLKGTLQIVKTKNNGNFDQRWQDQFNATIENYLGLPAPEFNVGNEKYIPTQYSGKVLPELENYITLTCVPDETVYTMVEIVDNDNWAKHKYFNVSSNDLLEVITKSLQSSHPVLWNGILTKDMVYADQNVVLLPEKAIPAKISSPITEKQYSDQLRTSMFQKFSVGTDSYLIINGIVEDEKGRKFYKASNCCGPNKLISTDHLYLSEVFLKSQTLSIMVNKTALPVNLAGKPGK